MRLQHVVVGISSLRPITLARLNASSDLESIKQHNCMQRSYSQVLCLLHVLADALGQRLVAAARLVALLKAGAARRTIACKEGTHKSCVCCMCSPTRSASASRLPPGLMPRARHCTRRSFSISGRR